MKTDNKIQQLSYEFAKSIIILYKKLSDERMYDIGRQILRSGTSIGANIEEAIWWQSKSDFIHKMSISYKEARETYYRLRLLHDTKFIHDDEYCILEDHITHILSTLSKIITTSKWK